MYANILRFMKDLPDNDRRNDMKKSKSKLISKSEEKHRTRKVKTDDKQLMSKSSTNSVRSAPAGADRAIYKDPEMMHRSFGITHRRCMKFDREFLLQQGEQNNANFPKISLMDFGFQLPTGPSSKCKYMNDTHSTVQIVANAVANGLQTDCEVLIGGEKFNCHWLVLVSFTRYFRELPYRSKILLPEDRISPLSFKMLYDWMCRGEPTVDSEALGEFYVAANYLRAPDVLDECWMCLDSSDKYQDYAAFTVFLHGLRFQDFRLKEVMLSRINRYFLPMVASRYFLKFTARDVCLAFGMNNIAVNSEVEVFMAGVMWLSHNWAERQRYVAQIMRNVRFGLMPPWFLPTIKEQNETPEIMRVVENDTVQKYITEGLTYTTAYLFFANRPKELIHFLKNNNMRSPIQRKWLIDRQCEYHHLFGCPNTSYISYKSFLEYMEFLQTKGSDYWRSFEIIGDMDDYDCCEEFENVKMNPILDTRQKFPNGRPDSLYRLSESI